MPSLISPGVYDVGGGVTVHLATLQPNGTGTLTALGWEYEVNGYIEGLTGHGTHLYGDAVNAILAVPLSPPLQIGVSLVGQPGATLQSYRIQPKSNGVVEFRLGFRSIGAPTTGSDSVCRISNTAVEREVNVSINGNVIGATYASGGTLQPKVVSHLWPQPIVEVTRLETDYPTIASEDYVSTTNSALCPWDNNPNHKRCWLCIGIEAESKDLKTWSKTYRFQFSAPRQTSPFISGWDKVVSATGPDGNGPPSMSTSIAFEDNTKQLAGFQVYPTRDFMAFAFLF